MECPRCHCHTGNSDSHIFNHGHCHSCAMDIGRAYRAEDERDAAASSRHDDICVCVLAVGHIISGRTPGDAITMAKQNYDEFVKPLSVENRAEDDDD